MSDPLGRRLPGIRTGVPGPASRELAARLARVESRNITAIDDHGPIFWEAARGANVMDVDGNVYVDLTAGFGVSAAGHADPAVADAIARQAARLPHALGDVHPAALKVRLLERLAELAPGDLSVSILSANGADAVDSALKTAFLATGRPGVIAFEGAYHGLGFGALAVTWDERFRKPFTPLLRPGVRFAPYPGRPRATGSGIGTAPPDEVDAATALAEVERLVDEASPSDYPVGAVIVEPILGRGGIIVPPADFLPALRRVCTDRGLVLIVDEIYTGFGRTGRWFAVEHTGVVPDILVVGKALAGSLPLSAAIATPAIMGTWPESQGEALHTSTFLGNPITAAAALAHLDRIEELGLVERARVLGERVAERGRQWADPSSDEHAPGVAGVRGLGLMRAIALGGEDSTERAVAASRAALKAGVIVLPEGGALAITPPLAIGDEQLDAALEVVRESLMRG